MSRVQRADPGARRRALLLVIGTAALGTALVLGIDRFGGPLRAWVLSDPASARQRITLVFFLFALGASAPLLGFAVYLWTLGSRIVRARLFPPPGQRVLHDTEVIEGQGAVSRGRALKVFAGCLAGFSVLFWIVLWRLAVLLRSAS